MSNRRSFLKILGLGAVAAPVAAKLIVEAEATPVVGYPAGTGARREREMLEARRKLVREYSTKLAPYDESIDSYALSTPMWVDWARKAVVRG